MEIEINNNTKETLVLTKATFKTLLDSVINHFKEAHNITESYKDSQLFGFGNYDTDKPNLKQDLELVLKGYVNGKYLYNKSREIAKGKPIVKISREYKYAYFNYIGYKNIHEFIESDNFTQIQRAKQLQLIHQTIDNAEHYYVCYYVDEDHEMNKGQMTISNQWKHIEAKYIYEEEATHNQGFYTFFGSITTSEGFAFFDTKYIVDNKKREGAKFTFFVGKSSPNERTYLIGTYSGFDKYDRIISGKMILKKVQNLFELEREINKKDFDPILCLELNKNRLVVESEIKKNPLLFSKKSPYAQVLFDTHGKYKFEFKDKEQSFPLKCEIQKYHLNIISNEDYIMIENDLISIVNKGQILNFDFVINGVFNFQKVSIYIKASKFYNKGAIEGSYIGVDVNNKIINGLVMITKL